MRIIKAGIQYERIRAIKDEKGWGRRKLYGWPADNKLSDLRRALLKVIQEYNLLCNVGPEARTRWKRLKAIHKLATALSKELAADEQNGGMFTEHWRPLWSKDMPAASKLMSKMSELVEQSGLLETSPGHIAAQTKAHYSASDIRAFDWLVGRELPKVFEQFFRTKVAVYREGPYLDFALQVLTEFDITNEGHRYSGETLMIALRRGRRSRRGVQKY